MIIVAGQLHVEPNTRDEYLADCQQVIELARSAAGCVDFHISADPLEAGRINVFEQWQTVADVEQFRARGPSPDQTAAIRDAAIFQYVVSESHRL